ncbi:protein FAM189B [Protobothrops mucrosquamatus]|uniref:protein FAM189B n=1 Tax=Protobothrops mucrosquamatus TaxID=103944 RepID=UPI0010FB1640|nr:protein FAM189B [Protobothrops mucrosquamatus]
MPSRSDSSYSLTGRTSHSFTHLRVRRAWLQVILLLGFIQMILGVLIVTLSLLVTTSIPSQHPIGNSCPIWAGFPLAFSGVVGIVSWRRPFTPVITFFTLLSVLGVMLTLAGSILSCQHAQQVKSLEVCERIRQRDGSSIPKELGWRRSLKGQKCIYAPSESGIPACGNKSDVDSNCSRILLVLKDLLFSICGLTIFSIVVCTLSAIMCCIQIFSVDILHVLSPPRSSSLTLDCTSPPDTFLQHMLDLDEFVPPVPPPPYYPPEYTCSSETDAQSITYNGSMDSPVPLYPTDFPPSYEAVMGLRGDSQITFFTLLSVLGVMLTLAGSILSCQHAQQVKSLEVCERIRQRDGSSIPKELGWRRSLKGQEKVYPTSDTIQRPQNIISHFYHLHEQLYPTSDTIQRSGKSVFHF